MVAEGRAERRERSTSAVNSCTRSSGALRSVHGLAGNPVAGRRAPAGSTHGRFQRPRPARGRRLSGRTRPSEQDAAIFTVGGVHWAADGRAARPALAGRRLVASASVHVRRSLHPWGRGPAEVRHACDRVPLVDQVAGALDRLSRRERLDSAASDLVFVNRGRGASSMTRRCGAASTRRSSAAGTAKRPSASTTCGTRSGRSQCRCFRCTDVKAYMGHADIADDDDLRPPRAPARMQRPS